MIRLIIIAVLLTGIGFKIAAAPKESKEENVVCTLNGAAFALADSGWRQNVRRTPGNDALCRPPLFVHPLTPPRRGK